MKKIFLSILIVSKLYASAQVQLIDKLQITGGTLGVGKVLTSDATGIATWQNTIVKGSDSGSTVGVTVLSPILSPTGRIWMDRNLGASRRAQSSDDYMAYGQLYQWGRGNDGHADIKWTSATEGTAVNGTTTTISLTNYPDNNLFIISNNFWNSVFPFNNWQGITAGSATSGVNTGINNPCPEGFRLPTKTEWDIERNYMTNITEAFQNPLRLTATGLRSNDDGLIVLASQEIYYWSSTIGGAGIASYLYGNRFTFGNYNTNQCLGMPIRCIQN